LKYPSFFRKKQKQQAFATRSPQMQNGEWIIYQYCVNFARAPTVFLTFTFKKSPFDYFSLLKSHQNNNFAQTG
jgi:hypothetical protein